MPLWRVVISQTLFGQLVQNRIWLQGETFQEASEVTAHVWNSWINTVKVFQHSGLRYTSVQAVQHDIDEGTIGGSFTELRNVTGNQAEETQGFSFAAGVMRFSTGRAGPKFHGRYYIAGIRQGGTQFGQFKSDEFANWQGQINILKNAYLGSTGGSTGLSLFIRGEKVVHNTLVTDIGLNPVIGVQRRRNLGVGA